MKTVLKTLLALVESLSICFVLVLLSNPVQAESRFSAHRPNYGFYRSDSLGESEGGGHLEYNFSTRYKISSFGDEINGSEDRKRWSAYLAYTGRFDFFLESRDSSPVINRLNNPELLIRRHKRSNEEIFHYIQFAYGHESNGQQTNSQELFDSDIRVNRNDFISRGWDYISIEANYNRYWKQDKGNCNESYNCTQFWFTFKGILSDGIAQGAIEDTIFIPDRPADDDIRNYDGLQAVISHEWERDKKFFDEFEVSLKIITGSRGPFENITGELQLRGTTSPVPFFNLGIPLYFVYRNGYLEEIADYSLRTEFTALGLKFRL